MPRKRKQSNADIDWYLISIDRLKQIAVALVILLVGGGAYFYYFQTQNPKQKAQNAIQNAESSLNELASSKEFTTFRSEFDRAKQKLDEAKALFTSQKYPEADTAAVESQTIAKTALAHVEGERESDAQFLSVEGEVEFQKANSSDWKKADPRAALFNGDWVKTGGSASAELIFSNGSLYTVGPNALLEIYSVFNPQTSKKDNSVQMKGGQIVVNTTDDVSTINTPGTKVVVNSDSSSQVAVDPAQKATQVVSLRGSSEIAPATGGPAVGLTSGEQVTAKEGAISAKSTVALPPALETPGENQVFQLAPDLTVDFIWTAQPDARGGYVFQVSRSRLFAVNAINARKNDTSARTKITSDGTFYWRIASVDKEGHPGPFSQFRRFRVTGGTGGSSPSAGTDKTPPPLEMKVPFPLGSPFWQIEGKTESGAQVFINDEEVGVGADGSFRKVISFSKIGLNPVIIKAVDPAGNQTIARQSVNVEE